MLTSLSFIFLLGLAMAAVCQRLKLPRIIGMLLTGILLGPYALNLLDPSILAVSADLRQMALIIILLKAGLSLNLADLKRVGRPAVMMACVPASFEILGFLIFAPHILGVTRVEAAVMGAVLSAVSPAVVIPRMVQLMEERYGTDKSIPQMIMAGASCDDIFVIVLFSTFVTMAQGGAVHGTDLLNVPVSIILGNQHKGYYSSGSILSADGSGNMAEGNRIHIRSSGCSKYSLRAENKEHSRCIIPSFGKIWKTVDRGRGYSFCSGWSRCRYPLYA